MLHEAHERLTKAQERYKRTFDNRLCRQKEQVRAGDSIFLRIEKRDDSQTGHKLAPLAEGPLKVIEANNRVVTIERTDGTIERVSRDRVTLAPPAQTEDSTIETVRPMTDAELIPTEITVNEEMNLKTAPGQDSEKRTEQSTQVPIPETPDQVVSTTDKDNSKIQQKIRLRS